jgi:hypothetical protein
MMRVFPARGRAGACLPTPWKELQPSGHSSESVSACLVECGLANGQIQAQNPLIEPEDDGCGDAYGGHDPQPLSYALPAMPSSSRIRSFAAPARLFPNVTSSSPARRSHMPARPGLFVKLPYAISAKFVKFRTAAKGNPEADPPARGAITPRSARIATPPG